jgi:hypothetical protein
MTIRHAVTMSIAPPTSMVCTDGEWTVSDDVHRVASAGRTIGEAMGGYVGAWAARIADELLRDATRTTRFPR